jgi:hypothetical protein
VGSRCRYLKERTTANERCCRVAENGPNEAWIYFGGSIQKDTFKLYLYKSNACPRQSVTFHTKCSFNCLKSVYNVYVVACNRHKSIFSFYTDAQCDCGTVRCTLARSLAHRILDSLSLKLLIRLIIIAGGACESLRLGIVIAATACKILFVTGCFLQLMF